MAGGNRRFLKLTWSHVDLHAQTVRLNAGATKSDAGRVIVLDGEFWRRFKFNGKNAKWSHYPRQSPTLLCPYVVHRNGKPSNRAANQDTILLQAHGCRDMVRAGMSEKIAMSVSGHKTRSVFDRYDIVDEADLKEAARQHSEYVQSRDDAAKVVVAKRA